MNGDWHSFKSVDSVSILLSSDSNFTFLIATYTFDCLLSATNTSPKPLPLIHRFHTHPSPSLFLNSYTLSAFITVEIDWIRNQIVEVHPFHSLFLYLYLSFISCILDRNPPRSSSNSPYSFFQSQLSFPIQTPILHPGFPPLWIIVLILICIVSMKCSLVLVNRIPNCSPSLRWDWSGVTLLLCLCHLDEILEADHFFWTNSEELSWNRIGCENNGNQTIVPLVHLFRGFSLGGWGKHIPSIQLGQKCKRWATFCLHSLRRFTYSGIWWFGNIS